MENRSCLIGLAVLVVSAAAASGGTVEGLFLQALQERGEAYLETRATLLDAAGQDDTYLKERLSSADSHTRLLAEALWERIHQPERYRSYEELMIVPIQFALKTGERTVIGPKPFENIAYFARRRAVSSVREETSELTAERLHDAAAFAFLTEMALHNAMLTLPRLSDHIEWSKEETLYPVQDVAAMLGVLPETAKRWRLAGLFGPASKPPYPLSVSQTDLRAFYAFYSDKIINPAYVHSPVPVQRVVHSDMMEHMRRYTEDPGSLFRCYAVLMLGSCSRPQAADVLYSVYLKDTSDCVRAYCVEGFSAQTQCAAIRRAMEDPSWRVRRAAVIISRENPGAFEVSDYVRLIRREDSSREGVYREDVYREVIRVLAEKRDMAAIEPLIAMFEYSNSDADIAKALIALDPNSIYHAIEHQNPGIREGAWSGLAFSDIRFPLSSDYLAGYFERFANDTWISTILYALAKDNPAYVPCLLEHENIQVRIRAIETLDQSYNHNTNAVDLKQLAAPSFQDRAPEVRRAALYAMRHFCDDQEIASLYVTALDDPDAGCRSAALEYGNLNVAALDGLLKRETDPAVRVTAVSSLSRHSDPACGDVLIRYLRDENPRIRWMVAMGLGRFNDQPSAKALEQLVSDTDRDVQSRAIRSIVESNNGLLEKLLIHAEADVRREAYSCLGYRQNKATVELLIQGTHDPDVSVRGEALRGLGHGRYSYDPNHPAVMAVQDALRDEDAGVRAAAILALNQMIGPQSINAVVRCLHDPDQGVKRNTIYVLASSQDPGAVWYLLDAMEKEEDKVVLVEIVNALKTITGNLLTKEEWMQWRNEKR